MVKKKASKKASKVNLWNNEIIKNTKATTKQAGEVAAIPSPKLPVYSFEVIRENVSLTQFMFACKKACEAAKAPFKINRESFVKGKHTYERYYDAGRDKKYRSEVRVIDPYTHITYIKFHDGHSLSESCSFELDKSGKTGKGYYYASFK